MVPTDEKNNHWKQLQEHRSHRPRYDQEKCMCTHIDKRYRTTQGAKPPCHKWPRTWPSPMSQDLAQSLGLGPSPSPGHGTRPSPGLGSWHTPAQPVPGHLLPQIPCKKCMITVVLPNRSFFISFAKYHFNRSNPFDRPSEPTHGHSPWAAK